MAAGLQPPPPALVVERAKPCQTEPETPSPVTPEESNKEIEQNAACCSDLRLHLQGLGVKGKKLDELAALADLTADHVDAVYTDAEAKCTDGGNAIGLMIRMLLEGERGESRLKQVQRERRSKESAVASLQLAKDFLASLPKKSDPSLLEAAKVWVAKYGKARVITTAKVAVPDLYIKDHNGVPSWYVLPFEDERVLVACHQYDRLNVNTYKQLAQEHAEEQAEGEPS